MKIAQLSKNRWRLDVSVTLHGVQYRERQIVSGTHRQAIDSWHSLRYQLRDRARRGEIDRNRDRQSFRWILENYRRDRARVGRLATMAPIFDRLIRDCGSYPVDQIDSRFAAYCDILNTEISARTHRQLACATRNRIKSVARSACRHAYRHGMIDREPLRMVQMHRETPRDRVLTDSELLRIRNAIPEVARRYCAPWLASAFEFSIRNPIRAGDLRQLRREAWDRIAGLVRYTSGKTSTQVTAIDYPDWSDILPIIRSEYVFGEVWGEQIGRDRIGDIWQAVREASGIGDVRWHDLRHHAATWLFLRQIKAPDIQRVGGWRTRAMVERYHHLDADDAAANIRDRLVYQQDHKSVSPGVSL